LKVRWNGTCPKSADKGGEKKFDVENPRERWRTRDGADFQWSVSLFFIRFSATRPNPAGDLKTP
jgi:hypothetical protein